MELKLLMLNLYKSVINYFGRWAKNMQIDVLKIYYGEKIVLQLITKWNNHGENS